MNAFILFIVFIRSEHLVGVYVIVKAVKRWQTGVRFKTFKILTIMPFNP
jgi:hypothetical protein